MTLLLTRLMLFFQDRLAKDERGATTVEYGLLLLAIVAAFATIAVTLGGKLNDFIDGLNL